MLTNESGHYAIERVYSDPSAAHEKGMRLKSRGAYRVTIEPDHGRYVLTAWFLTCEQATKALE